MAKLKSSLVTKALDNLESAVKSLLEFQESFNPIVEDAERYRKLAPQLKTLADALPETAEKDTPKSRAKRASKTVKDADNKDDKDFHACNTCVKSCTVDSAPKEAEWVEGKVKQCPEYELDQEQKGET